MSTSFSSFQITNVSSRRANNCWSSLNWLSALFCTHAYFVLWTALWASNGVWSGGLLPCCTITEGRSCLPCQTEIWTDDPGSWWWYVVQSMKYFVTIQLNLLMPDWVHKCPERFCKRNYRTSHYTYAHLVEVKETRCGCLILQVCYVTHTGANDVSMIQMADVGVGVSGQEGRQAVMASDFAIGQFQFLKKLLLVHGHWNYNRLGYMVLYNFYRNAVFVLMLFW